MTLYETNHPNLVKLFEAEAKVSQEERVMFHTAMIGALSAVVEPFDWAQIVDRCFDDVRKRRQAKKD